MSTRLFKFAQFGKLLRKIRLKKGVGLRELAREVGVDHAYISQVEIGKVGMPIGTTSMAIARILESPVLMELAEYALVRQLFIMENQRYEAYAEMAPRLREELKITEGELKKIKEMWSKMSAGLLAAMDRRGFKPASGAEEKRKSSRSGARAGQDRGQK
jgi:transcriptional regulator with XRE-family HTH domain